MLGKHWMRFHQDGNDLVHDQRMNYASYKLFAWMYLNEDFCRELLKVAHPDAIFICRHHGRSEEKGELEVSPAALGRRHAAASIEEMHQTILPNDRCYWSGINEPDSNYLQKQIDIYETARVTLINAAGGRANVYSFGVGHVSTYDLDPLKSPNWEPYAGSAAVTLAGKNIVEMHEYGMPAEYGWGHWCNRLSHCPYDFTFVIGECGIDSGVARAGENKGYRHPDMKMNEEEYADWLEGYFDEIFEDPRVHSAQVFTYDFSKPWGTFDVRVMRDIFEARWGGAAVYAISFACDRNKEPPEPGKPLPVGTMRNTIDPVVLQAIMNIEAGGLGFVDGRLKIRFEAHIFKQQLGIGRRDTFDKNFAIADSESWAHPQMWYDESINTWRNIHEGGQDMEWLAFEDARAEAPTAAYNSISMGVGQIMGFNAQRIGFDSAGQMFAMFADSQAAQVIGVVNYILSDSGILRAVEDKDWDTIARLYNGAGNVVVYSNLLQKEYEGLQNSA